MQRVLCVATIMKYIEPLIRSGEAEKEKEDAHARTDPARP